MHFHAIAKQKNQSFQIILQNLIWNSHFACKKFGFKHKFLVVKKENGKCSKKYCISRFKGIKSSSHQKIFVKKESEPLTIEKIKQAHRERLDEIRARLQEFEDIWQHAGDEKLWEEMISRSRNK